VKSTVTIDVHNDSREVRFSELAGGSFYCHSLSGGDVYQKLTEKCRMSDGYSHTSIDVHSGRPVTTSGSSYVICLDAEITLSPHS